MNAYSLVIPQRWEMGKSGAMTLYADCADCGMHEPEIAGFLGEGTTFSQIGVVKRGEEYHLAMFCAGCWPRHGGES